MAEKEERILIDVINPGINCVYRLDNDHKGQSLCKHNGNMEPVTAKECRHCEEGMTRQEAIERIAYALAQRRYRGLADAIQFAEDENWQICLTDANYALNALLEDK